MAGLAVYYKHIVGLKINVLPLFPLRTKCLALLNLSIKDIVKNRQHVWNNSENSVVKCEEQIVQIFQSLRHIIKN